MMITGLVRPVKSEGGKMLPLIHLSDEEEVRAKEVAAKMIGSASGLSFAELDAAIEYVRSAFEGERVGLYRSTKFNPDSDKTVSG
ncbi:hypothetical protein [Maridesulfovibrio frigidus]|uniref:hypothetical protein n=1 Tax=Maridesulfovibrio frigidus TaxID=340956 RepID=UPI0004E0F93D|nr:hypothetical protein [Maridesulfovibrio frigidus]